MSSDTTQEIVQDLVREMAEEDERDERRSMGGGGSPIYALGMIGAGVYYWRRADPDLASRATAIGKALVWPAFVVYDLLRHVEGDPSD